MEIVLNGTPHQLGDIQSVAELVAHMELTNKAIAVAVNRNVIARQKWEDYRFQAHDQVDVVRAIGGG
jgi:sulfur carrier protein